MNKGGPMMAAFSIQSIMGLFITLACIIAAIFAIVAIVYIKCSCPGPPSKKKFSLGMDVKLNMKAIIRWEQLRKKSFSLMDYTDKDDVETLLYTTTICNNEGLLYTYDIFRGTLNNGELVREIISKLERETAVLSQFQKKQEGANIDNTEGSPEMTSSIISTLIMSGLNAHYAMNEMELCDLPLYIEAYERKRKEEMESARMWTYLTILPHIDAKKMENGAKDLITFPWEEPEIEKEIKDTEIERFELFMQKGRDLLNL